MAANQEKSNTSFFGKSITLILLCVLIISFVCLAFYINEYPIPPFDLEISLFLQQHHSETLDRIMLGISLFGELPYSLLMVVIVALIFYGLKFKRESYFILSILLSGLVILTVKNLINRPRPSEFYVRLVEINRFQSFPSGHVLSYILFFGFMIVLMRHLKEINTVIRKLVIYISIFFMTSISFSRIYLGAHWFTDTLGGMLLGVFCLVILSYLYLQPHKRRIGDKA